MIEVKSPDSYVEYDNMYNSRITRIFLAGSIEMGTAENWQAKVANDLSDLDKVVLLNPRRDDWNPDWEQDISNPEFKEQVEWELEALERSNLIVFYFDPNTKSPITLLELGLYAAEYPSECIVCCPKGYWRRGNVEIVCQRYGVKFTNTYEEFITAIRNKL
jgi:hypothetical protein